MTATRDPFVAAGPGDADVHAQRLIMLTCGLRLAYIVEALAELEIAQLLLDGPLPVDELARRTDVHPDALYRVLRCAASVGIFEETSDHVFGRTPLSDPLVSTMPYSLRPLVDYGTKSFVAAPYAALRESLRSAEPSTTAALGADFWEHLASRPDDDAFFDDMMTRLGGWETDRHLDVIRPERFASIVDIGGGKGWFLGAALVRAPETTGVLVERPEVVERARGVLEDLGVADRVTRRTADVFADELPTGAGAYLLKAVLHNHTDERVEHLLRRVRATIGDTGAPLFVIEQVVGPGNGFDHAKWLDVDMLVLFGGRERTHAQWRDLFALTGFELVGEPDEGRWTTLEARPV